MRITYSNQAAKAISKMDKPSKNRVKSAIELLPKGNVKRLNKSGLITSRLRIGGWRILFYYDDSGNLFIEKIAPRGDVYKGV